MKRRKAAAVAGAAAVTAVAATVGLGANLGLFGLAAPESHTGPTDGARPAVQATAPPAPAADD